MDTHRILLTESATATATAERVDLDERAQAQPGMAVRADGTVDLLIISPGWGSSGYYAPDVLREAAGLYAAGTHMYFDHPRASDDIERPERSLRDLVAVTVAEGRWDESGRQGPGVYARAKVFRPYRDQLDEIAQHIGVSHRAGGEGHWGEAEGRKGRIIDRIVEVRSVDFVTQPGRGGRILPLLESMDEARNAGHWFEARLHLAFTEMADHLFGAGHLTREERIALSSAIGDALDAFSTSVTAAAPGLYERDPYAEPPAMVESLRVSVPPMRHDAPHRTTGDDVPLTDQDVTRIAEAVGSTVGTALTEALGRIAPAAGTPPANPAPGTPPAAAADDLAEADRQELSELRARQLVSEAQTIAEAAFAEGGDHASADLPVPTVKVIVEAVRRDPPTGDDGKLDTVKLSERIKAEVDRQKAYLAEVAGPTGRITGMGATSTEVSEADRKAAADADEAWYRTLGLSEAGAKVAVAGDARVFQPTPA